jgi:multisubunit Na+/H+ antiporter MnhE subunit
MIELQKFSYFFFFQNKKKDSKTRLQLKQNKLFILSLLILLIYVFYSELIEENRHTFVHEWNHNQDINEVIIDYEIIVDF